MPDSQYDWLAYHSIIYIYTILILVDIKTILPELKVTYSFFGKHEKTADRLPADSNGLSQSFGKWLYESY